jgi:hypothetical protein
VKTFAARSSCECGDPGDQDRRAARGLQRPSRSRPRAGPAARPAHPTRTHAPATAAGSGRIRPGHAPGCGRRLPREALD